MGHFDFRHIIWIAPIVVIGIIVFIVSKCVGA